MFEIKSEITKKVLRYYFLNNKKRHYINELAKILDVDPGNMDRKLKQLEKEGVLHSETQGNQKYYFLNTKYPLLKEFKKVFDAKYGLKEQIASVVKSIKGLKEAYFFGSYAKDFLQQESDIDILVIGSHNSRELKAKIIGFQKAYQREFNIIDMTENEFKERKKKKDPFIETVFADILIKIV